MYDKNYMFGNFVLVTKTELDGWKDHYEMFDDYKTAHSKGLKFKQSMSEYPAASAFAVFDLEEAR